MTKQVQRRRGTASQHTSFTGAEGELSVNTTNKSVHVHDGVTAGGVEAARADLGNVSDADLNTALSGNTLASLTITSADINGGTIDGTTIGGVTPAAITGTTITGSSFVTTGDMTFGDNDKAIFGAGSDLQIYHNGTNQDRIESSSSYLILEGQNIILRNNGGTEDYAKFFGNGAVELYSDNSKKLATTSTGVDVTGTITSDGLTVDGDVSFSTQNREIKFAAGNTSVNKISVVDSGDAASAEIVFRGVNANQTQNIEFWTGSSPASEDISQAMTIKYDGKVGIGTVAPLRTLSAANIAADAQIFAGRTTSNGNLGNTAAGGRISFGSTDTATGVGYEGARIGMAAAQTWTVNSAQGAHLIFETTANSSTTLTERMRIDSSGNLLVGTTTYVGNSSTDTGGGFGIDSTGTYLFSTRDGETPAFFNRLTDDGDIAVFRKDGATVGSIGTDANSELFISGAGNRGGIGFYDHASGAAVRPVNSDGTLSDDDTDLGFTDSRFDDIYATNGTIQTSDRNEKQDIAELDEAEKRVAIAVKGLLRKFRWKSAVEEKGDDARIHFGIIAQDLQAAFEAEGLDAGDYAMFIHTTWTDEETGEEKSRMGVRYSELLAFIIAAI
jgi:hypothetical protein